MPASKQKQLKIAVVDDAAAILKLISVYLAKTGWDVSTYNNPLNAIEAIGKDPVDIVIADVCMPQMDGIAVLKKVKELCPKTDVIMMSGHADKDSAIKALRFGAFDFFEKPVRRDEMLATIERTARFHEVSAEKERLTEQVADLTRREAERFSYDNILGDSAAVRGVIRQLRLLERAPKTSVLILGESGTGKEVVARTIHHASPHATGPFVPVNCSAIPAELAESILFGHVKGAFTGATADRKGAFEEASGGTLFLDEVSDMPVTIQAKLLRVLEDGVVTRVGSQQFRSVDVRVVAATNADVEASISEGKFRQDLYFRLAAFAINLSPLRERKGDIPPLATHFVKELSQEMGFVPQSLKPEVVEFLKQHDYPGNVRELRNVLERALIESGGAVLEIGHIHFPSVSASRTTSPPVRQVQSLQSASDEIVQAVLAETKGNISAAARRLKVSRNFLYRRLQPRK